MRRNYSPGALIIENDLVPLERGGTGASDANQARNNLFIERASNVGQPHGAVPIGTDGKIPPAYFRPIDRTSVEIEGPISVPVDTQAVFTITNFDSRQDYLLVALSGSITQDGNQLFYKTPVLPGATGFLVNGIRFPVTATSVSRIPNKPSILSPGSNLTQNVTSVTVVTSDWSSAYPEDDHYSSDYQVGLDAAFTGLLTSLTSAVNNKTSFQFAIPTPGTKVWIRARHRGYYGGISPWSDAVVFTRTPEEKPLAPNMVNPGGDTTINTDVYTLQITPFQGTAVGDASAKVMWQLASLADFSDAVTSETGPGVYTKVISGLVTGQSKYIRAAHIGTQGWASDWTPAIKLTYLFLSPIPDRPTLVDPVSIAISQRPVIFKASPYTNARPGETMGSMEFQVALTSDFVTGLKTVTSPSGQVEYYNLNASSEYYARVRYVSVNGHRSDWSPVRRFTTAASFSPAGEVALIYGSNYTSAKFGVPLVYHRGSNRLVTAERVLFPTTTPQGAIQGLTILRDNTGSWVKDSIAPVIGQEPPAGEYDNFYYPAFDMDATGDKLVTLCFRTQSPGSVGTLYPVVLTRTANVWRYEVFFDYGITYSPSLGFANFFVGMANDGQTLAFYLGGVIQVMALSGGVWTPARTVSIEGFEQNPLGAAQSGLGRLDLDTKRMNLNEKILNIEGATATLVRTLTNEKVDSLAVLGYRMWIKHVTGTVRVYNALTQTMETVLLNNPSWPIFATGFNDDGTQAYVIQKDPGLVETYLLITLELNAGTWQQQGYRLVRKPHGSIAGATVPNKRFYSVSDSGLESVTDAGVIAVT